MKSILDRYLDRVLLYANRPESESEGIRQELKDHLLQKVEDLAGNGLPREEAILETLRQHGSPKTIGYKLRGSIPWIDIRSHGTARGVIAIGPRAIGIFAFGGVRFGSAERTVRVCCHRSSRPENKNRNEKKPVMAGLRCSSANLR